MSARRSRRPTPSKNLPAALRGVFKLPRTSGGRFKSATKYTGEMPDLVVEMMAEGASKSEVAVAMGISRETLYAWTDPAGPYFKPRLAEALAYGEQLAEAWWQRLGRLATVGGVPGFQATAYVWQTKNRFGWKDRVDIGMDTPLHVSVTNYATPEGEDGEQT